MGIQIKETGELSKKSALSLMLEGLKNDFEGVFVFASKKEKHSIVVQKNQLKTPKVVVSENILGKHFLHNGSLTNDSYMQVTKLQNQHGIPFYQALIQSGFVSYPDIQGFVGHHLAMIFDKIYDWQEGKYVVVEQVPHDVVEIEIEKNLWAQLFEVRKAFNDKKGDSVPAAELLISDEASAYMEKISFSAAEQKMLQMLQKTKSIKNLHQFSAVDEKLAKTFVRTLLDFGFLTASSGIKTDNKEATNYLAFNFQQISQNLDKLNFYELLGLPPSIDVKSVSRQYFSIAKDYHPDRIRHNESFAGIEVERVFAKITEAYQTLSNANSKKQYDEKLAGKTEGPGPDVKKVLESEGCFLDGMDNLRRGQFDKAEENFQRAIVLYNEEPEYYIRLGWAQYRLGLKNEDQALIEKGKKILQDSLKKDRVLDDVHYYFGMIYKNDLKYEKAKASFYKALQINKNHMQAKQEFNAVEMMLTKRDAGKKGWFGKS